MSISGSLARFSNEETNTNSKNIEYESNFSNNNNDDDIINKPSSGKKFNYSYNNQYFENEDDLFMALKKELLLLSVSQSTMSDMFALDITCFKESMEIDKDYQ